MADEETMPVTTINLDDDEVDVPQQQHKRKLDDVAPPDLSLTDTANGGDGADVVDDEAPDHPKRARLDDSASENGHKTEGENEGAEENAEAAADDENAPVAEESNEVQPVAEGEQKDDAEGDDTDAKETEVTPPENEKASGDEQQEPAADGEGEGNNASGEPGSESGSNSMTRKIEIPNNKVGVLIGKAGDTIKLLQISSGAKIQITRDADADPRAPSRPVELVGTLESLNKAERLIKDVIAEADAGGSPSLVARGFTTAMTTGATEIEIPVPGDKVGLIIGKGGETIRSLQTRSGARIQLIPQSTTGDQSKEKKVKVSGDKKQIDIARELIKQVMNQLPGRPSQFPTNNFSQQGYRPGGAPQWGARGPAHPMPYDYHQRGPHPSQNQHYPPQPYGGYPPQGAPRSYGQGWEQRPPQGPPQHSSGYDYYGHGHASNAPGPQSAHMGGHQSGPSMGAPPHSQANYYGQPRGSDYAQAAYSQTAPPPQSYGHGYGEQKYDTQSQVQQPYGGQGYPTQQQGYPPQQQYNRPPAPYGAPSQGAPPQGYAAPTASQPADASYQTPGSVAPAYSQNVQAQQPYPYAAGAAAQAPYGSAPVTSDGYAQTQPAAGYAQAGAQPVTAYSQPAGYAQGTAPPAAYGQYPQPTQSGYPDQSAAAASAAAYGYQGQVDPSTYAASQVYGAAPAVAQQGYPQPVPAQAGYAQPPAQSGGYPNAPAAAPVAPIGKTVSPQPGYAQYDASQMYAAPQ